MSFTIQCTLRMTVYDTVAQTYPVFSVNKSYTLDLLPDQFYGNDHTLDSGHIYNYFDNEINSYLIDVFRTIECLEVESYEVLSLTDGVSVAFYNPDGSNTYTLLPEVIASVDALADSVPPVDVFSGQLLDDTSILWSWSYAEDGLNPYVFIVKDGAGVTVAELPGDCAHYAETGLDYGTQYTRYVVRASDTMISAPSDSVSVTTAKAPANLSFRPISEVVVDRRPGGVRDLSDQVLTAFASGIGGESDLLVHDLDNTSIDDSYSLEIQMHGDIVDRYYHSVDVSYLFTLSGFEPVTIGELTVYEDFVQSSAVQHVLVNGGPVHTGSMPGYVEVEAAVSGLTAPEGLLDTRVTLTITGSSPSASVSSLFAQSGLSSETTHLDDTVRFSCLSCTDTPSETDVDFSAYTLGPFTLGTDEVRSVTATLLNPSREILIDSYRTAVNLSLSIKSDNPNIILLGVPPTVAFLGEEDRKNLTFDSRIASNATAKWHPSIESGYYYINNKEFFLHADGSPKSGLKPETMYRDYLFSYVVYCQVVPPIGGYLQKTFTAKIPADGLPHLISQDPAALLEEFFIANNYAQDMVLNGMFFVSSQFDVTISLDNETGLITAATDALDSYVGGGSRLLFVDGVAELDPAPLYFSPVCVQGVSGTGFIQVSGDYADDPLLLEDVVTGHESRYLTFGCEGVDPDSVALTNNGEPVLTYSYYNGVIALPVPAVASDVFAIRYKVKDSFALRYADGKCFISVHTEMPADYLDVAYETAETTQYGASDVDINPIFSNIDSGFIYIDHESKPAVGCEINRSDATIKANESVTIYVTYKDEDGGFVPNVPVKAFATEGVFVQDTSKTDVYGTASFSYSCPNAGLSDVLRFYDLNSGRNVQYRIKIHDTIDIFA